MFVEVLGYCGKSTMSNSAAKVGEIFTEAGAAFNKLAEMTMMLHPLSENITGSQSKTPVKRKVVEEKPAVTVITNSPSQVVHTPMSQQVTLNMLNAQAEMDVDPSQNGVKLEFDTNTEEVQTS